MSTLSPDKYAAALTEYEYAPKIIDSPREHRRCRNTLERLLFPERKLSAEEDAMAKLLSHLIEVYEDRTTVPPEASPRQVLRHLMQQRQLKQADLAGVLGTVSIVSEILGGKRQINAKQARKLADFFGLSAGVFV
jgi:HTH-type transcriptional regulator / antitoxin HigA